MDINEVFIEQINKICQAYPKQFSKILHVKTNINLLEYINKWCQPLEFNNISFATKVYYTINKIIEFPICKECGKSLIKNVYRLFNPHLDFCNQLCKHKNTLRIHGINRIYIKKPKSNKKKISHAYIIPYANDYTNDIKDIVKKYPYGFMNIFRHKCNLHVVQWLDIKFPQLKNHKLGTKINWILHDINDFPVCQHCGKKLDYDINPTKAYYKFCSKKCLCQHNSEDLIIREKQKNTMLANYGVEYAVQTDYAKKKRAEYQKLHNDEIVAATKQTKFELYGDPNWNNYDQIKKTKQNKYNDPYWNNSEKAKATYTCHCKENPDFIKQKNEKRHITCKKLYNDENYTNDAQGKSTRLAKYGHENPAHGQNEIKVRKTMQTRYGVDYALQNISIAKKTKTKYTYNSQNFDSSIELYLYLFLEDNKIEFIYKPNIKFQYEYNGKTHLYFPDFLILSTKKFIELKGDQFFNQNGNMFCPFRKKEWTDYQYAEKCALYEAKHQCMIKNNVTIIRYKSFCMKYIMKYINKKFGKTYVKSFKNIQTK